ncbi:Olfactory receptor 5K1 [Sciurus carolinensis]|uniref:Olfactory receptor 5K1 n=1 Tax=Sciurus carolinensis TaxID=30640 RepID=A0AA41MFG6_SCICA|nr:Olfactory receptor 5K1 [Sciurus carolinensis]
MGFTDQPDLKALLFVVFFAIYLVTMVGNLGLVALIYMEHRLHTPMYIFLGNLALMDSCCSCAITPKMLENFFSEDRRISLYECMAQFYFLCLAETADCFLLAAMAYDRYVTICRPLQYHILMSKKLCVQMTTAAYIGGNLHPMIHVGLLLRLALLPACSVLVTDLGVVVQLCHSVMLSDFSLVVEWAGCPPTSSGI